MERRRISEAVRRDFDFSLLCEARLGGMGTCVAWPRGDQSALEAFKRYDCEGKVVGCAEPQAMVRAVRGKASLNWHISEWAAGIRERLFALSEFKVAHPWLPQWVWQTIEARSQHGS